MQKLIPAFKNHLRNLDNFRQALEVIREALEAREVIHEVQTRRCEREVF